MYELRTRDTVWLPFTASDRRESPEKIRTYSSFTLKLAPLSPVDEPSITDKRFGHEGNKLFETLINEHGQNFD